MAKFTDGLKAAWELRSKLKKVDKKLKKIRTVGEAGAGMVRVHADGHQKILKIEISDELWAKNDKKFLQDLITAATNDALDKAKKAAQEEMKDLLGMLPPGFDVGSLLG